MFGLPVISAIITASLALAIPNTSRAEAEIAVAKPVAAPDGGGPIHLLSGNEPSYFVISHDSGSGENHAEFYLSIKYPLLTTSIETWFGEGSKLYFNYNGKYDYYAFSRESSPIISRKQNPGLMFEHLWPPASHMHLQSLKTGYFHESNGQTLDNRKEYLATENARDYVSRGWDYIPLEAKFAVSEKRRGIFGNLYLNLQGRYFLDRQMLRHDREDEIFWETVAEQPRIEEYDGVRATVSTVFILPYTETRQIKFNASLRGGYRGFNLSQRYDANFHLLEVPLYVYYFRGYGVELATYHQKGTTYGIGFEFW